MLRDAPMLSALQFRHRYEIVREQAIRLDKRARRGVERRIAEPMTEAQHMLLEDRLFRNVGVFLEIRLQYVKIGFVRRGDVTHFSDPFEREAPKSLPPQYTLAPSSLLQ